MTARVRSRPAACTAVLLALVGAVAVASCGGPPKSASYCKPICAEIAQRWVSVQEYPTPPKECARSCVAECRRMLEGEGPSHTCGVEAARALWKCIKDDPPGTPEAPGSRYLCDGEYHGYSVSAACESEDEDWNGCGDE